MLLWKHRKILELESFPPKGEFETIVTTNGLVVRNSGIVGELKFGTWVLHKFPERAIFPVLIQHTECTVYEPGEPILVQR